MYFDHAATTFPTPQRVIDAVSKAMKHVSSADRGSSSMALEASRKLFGVRDKVSAVFGASPKRTVFTMNATQSLNTVLMGAFVPGDHVITTSFEHNSVLRPLYYLQSTGVEVSIVDFCRPEEIVSGMKKAIKPNTKAVVMTHASNLLGWVFPIDEAAALCKEKGIHLIIDAAQSAGLLSARIDEGLSAVCFTGHKALLGPQGTGGFCLNPELDIHHFLRGGTGVQTFSKEHPEQMPVRLEAGTHNLHGLMGLEAAVDLLFEEGVHNRLKKERDLRKLFYDLLKEEEEIIFYGPEEEALGVIPLNIGDLSSGEAGEILSNKYGIITRTGGHCAPLAHQSLGTEKRGMVRFSFGYSNTEKEVHQAAQALIEIIHGKDII